MQIRGRFRVLLFFCLLPMTMLACRGGRVVSKVITFCDSTELKVYSLQSVDQINFSDEGGVPLSIDGPGVTVENVFSFSTEVPSHGASTTVFTLKWASNGKNYEIQHVKERYVPISYAKEDFVVNNGLEINEVVLDKGRDGPMVSVKFTDADGVVKIFSARLTYENFTGEPIVFDNKTSCNSSCTEESVYYKSECSDYHCDYSCDNGGKGSYESGACGADGPRSSDLTPSAVGISECPIASVELPAEVRESYSIPVKELPRGEE